MRFMTFGLALLMVGGAAAQDANAAPAVEDGKNFTYPMIETKHRFVIDEPQLKIASALPTYDRRVLVSPEDRQSNTCWFIRSYLFERKDGEAPVLKGETTCTPSNSNIMRNAKRRGAVRLVPLGW